MNSSLTDTNANLNLVKQNRFNENLLINSQFEQGIINQRGQSSYTCEQTWMYTIDRWKMWNATLTVQSQSILVKSNDNAGYKRITQMLPINFYINSNNIYTFSVALKIKKVTGTVQIRIIRSTYNYMAFKLLPVGTNLPANIYTITLPTNVANNETIIGVDILANNDAESSFELEIYAAKLEVGSQSTLKAYSPYDKALEFEKCQYFYRALKQICLTGCVTDKGKFICIPYDYSNMRIAPKITYGFEGFLQAGGYLNAIGNGLFQTIQQSDSFISTGITAITISNNSLRIQLGAFTGSVENYILTPFNQHKILLFSSGTINFNIFLDAEI